MAIFTSAEKVFSYGDFPLFFAPSYANFEGPGEANFLWTFSLIFWTELWHFLPPRRKYFPMGILPYFVHRVMSFLFLRATKNWIMPRARARFTSGSQMKVTPKFKTCTHFLNFLKSWEDLPSTLNIFGSLTIESDWTALGFEGGERGACPREFVHLLLRPILAQLSFFLFSYDMIWYVSVAQWIFPLYSSMSPRASSSLRRT